MLTVQKLVVWRRRIRSHHQMEWARVRCLGPELVACSDDAGNACNEMIIGNVYELIYIRWSHVLGHLVGHVMGWSSHYSSGLVLEGDLWLDVENKGTTHQK